MRAAFSRLNARLEAVSATPVHMGDALSLENTITATDTALSIDCGKTNTVACRMIEMECANDAQRAGIEAALAVSKGEYESHRGRHYLHTVGSVDFEVSAVINGKVYIKQWLELTRQSLLERARDGPITELEKAAVPRQSQLRNSHHPLSAASALVDTHIYYSRYSTYTTIHLGGVYVALCDLRVILEAEIVGNADLAPLPAMLDRWIAAHGREFKYVERSGVRVRVTIADRVGELRNNAQRSFTNLVTDLLRVWEDIYARRINGVGSSVMTAPQPPPNGSVEHTAERSEDERPTYAIFPPAAGLEFSAKWQYRARLEVLVRLSRFMRLNRYYLRRCSVSTLMCMYRKYVAWRRAVDLERAYLVSCAAFVWNWCVGFLWCRGSASGFLYYFPH